MSGTVHTYRADASSWEARVFWCITLLWNVTWCVEPRLWNLFSFPGVRCTQRASIGYWPGPISNTGLLSTPHTSEGKYHRILHGIQDF